MSRTFGWIGLLAIAAIASPQTGFRLKNGDNVLFYGDSITEQRLYTNFVETFVLTRFPNLHVRFRNTGVGGDRVTGGWAGAIDLRLARDFVPYKPTVATIMLGMNDASYRVFDQAVFDTYANGYSKIVADLKAMLPACKLTLIQPSPFDDFARKPNWDPGYNSVLVRYGEFVKQLAAKNGLQTIDLNAPIVASLQQAAQLDPVLAQKLIADRVHPGEQCQLLMGAEILKGWGAPAVVTDVAVDLSKRKVLKAERTQVSLGEKLSWTQVDECLPFPLKTDDKVLMLALQASDFISRLNRQTLTVLGLKEGTYTLKIDGKAVGDFTSLGLAQGLNLALLKTPMVDQAFRVHELTNRHNALFNLRWRNIQLPYGSEPGLQKAMAGMEAFEEEIVKAQRAAAKPLPRTYELFLKEDGPTASRGASRSPRGSRPPRG